MNLPEPRSRIGATSNLSCPFSNVDLSPHLAGLRDYLVETGKLKFTVGQVAQVIKRLKLSEGDSVLDVGCGMALDVMDISRLVGKSGKITLLDKSHELISAVGKEIGLKEIYSEVEFLNEDAHSISSKEDTYNAVRISRTLMHVDDPGTIISEARRVAKSNGRIVAFEPNWLSLSLPGRDDSCRSLVEDNIRAMIRNPSIGRDLDKLFQDNAIQNITVTKFPFILRSFATANLVLRLEPTLKAFTDAGKISKSDVEAWVSELKELDKNGSFRASFDCYLVSGTK